MRVASVLTAVGLLAATGAHAAVRQGTLVGTVTRGPIAPICVAEQPCDAPAANLTLLFVRGTTVVGRTLTNTNGRYLVRLPAGAYVVRRPSAGSTDRKLQPNRVFVTAARIRRIDFSIDTGIR